MNTIAYLVNTFLRPSEVFIYDQIKSLRNFNAEILTKQRKNKELFPIENVNAIAENNLLEFFLYTFFRKSALFESVINRKNVSLIHAHFGIEGVYALSLKKKFRLPLFVTFHGQDITRLPKFVIYPPAWLNYWIFHKELQKEGDVFIAVSEFIKNKLLEKGFPKDKVLTHYIGTSTKVEIPSGKKGKIVLTAGRLVEKKGTEYLIRAVREIVKSDNDVKLFICGDGPLRNKLESLTKSLKLENNVFFAGWQGKDGIHKLMNEASIFSLPSVTAADGDCEGLGMVILESMAHGLPVVGTKHGGIPEVVMHGETGFLVPERNHFELAQKIQILLSDGGLREKMGRRGREVVEEKFDIIKQTAKLEELYKKYV